MFEPFKLTESRTENETNFLENLEYLIQPEKCRTEAENIAVLANTSSFLFWFLQDVNWVGFYIKKKDQLFLGPFQGLPACTPLSLGSGVCGTSMKEGKPKIVNDTSLFPGHIACDKNSRSEIAIPFAGTILLDIDSPVKNRFSKDDLIFLQKICNILEKKLF